MCLLSCSTFLTRLCWGCGTNKLGQVHTFYFFCFGLCKKKKSYPVSLVLVWVLTMPTHLLDLSCILSYAASHSSFLLLLIDTISNEAPDFALLHFCQISRCAFNLQATCLKLKMFVTERIFILGGWWGTCFSPFGNSNKRFIVSFG